MSARRRRAPKGDAVTGFAVDARCEGSWKLTLPCTRAEALAIAALDDPLAELDPPPTLMTSEPDEARPDAWQLDAYFEQAPDAAAIALVRALVPSATAEPAIEHIPEQDWLTLSQAGLEPIRAGRFYVHTPAEGASDAPAGAVVFAIEAGRAFGTGHHQTTAGCLTMLDRMARRGARFHDVVDVGTGTGLLAFAAQRLWPQARVIASDIDAVAVDVAAQNAVANGFAVGRGRGRIELVAAPGLSHRRLQARAPYDLILANILAGPLVELAPVLAGALKSGGSLVLAGLLGTQAGAVAAAYRRQGLRLAETIIDGDWPILRLVRRRGARKVVTGRDRPRTGDWASDGTLLAH